MSNQFQDYSRAELIARIAELEDQIKEREAWIAREIQLASVEPGVVPDIARSCCRVCGDSVVYQGAGRWVHTTPGHNHRPTAK